MTQAAETRLDTFKKKGSASLKAIGTAAAGLAVAGAAADYSLRPLNGHEPDRY